MDIERAKAVCAVSRQLIDSAKVEVKFLDTVGAIPSGDFFGRTPGEEERRALQPKPGRVA